MANVENTVSLRSQWAISRKRMGFNLWPIIILLVSIPTIWYLLIWLKDYPTFILPPPKMVAEAVVNDWGTFWFHTKSTTITALEGYAISNLLALVLALIFVYVQGLESFVKPWTMMITMVPFPVIAGIFAVTFREPLVPKLTIVVLITFYPLLVNLTRGLRSADQVLLDRMKVLHASRWQVFWKIQWPAALPFYIAAHEISFAGSIIGAIVSEWFFAREGLGFLIIRSQMQYRTDKLFAVAIIGMALELIALSLVYVSQRIALKWRYQ